MIVTSIQHNKSPAQQQREQALALAELLQQHPDLPQIASWRTVDDLMAGQIAFTDSCFTDAERTAAVRIWAEAMACEVVTSRAGSSLLVQARFVFAEMSFEVWTHTATAAVEEAGFLSSGPSAEDIARTSSVVRQLAADRIAAAAAECRRTPGYVSSEPVAMGLDLARELVLGTEAAVSTDWPELLDLRPRRLPSWLTVTAHSSGWMAHCAYCHDSEPGSMYPSRPAAEIGARKHLGSSHNEGQRHDLGEGGAA